MKLYAWHPKGHGPLSFFVVAAGEEQATKAVRSEIERCKKLPVDDQYQITDYDCSGWPENYTLAVFEPGQVEVNDNS